MEPLGLVALNLGGSLRWCNIEGVVMCSGQSDIALVPLGGGFEDDPPNTGKNNWIYGHNIVD